jgi:3-deoxy-D-manno-octulosonate 8-phosphate phosphatase (KDO 8-P phosphatase)
LINDTLERARRIQLILMDCDGVLTDGRLYFSDRGEELKVFHVRDGQGLVSWHAAGFDSGIISGRDARAIVEARAAELGIKYVRVKSANKVDDLKGILAEAKLETKHVAFIGDDIGDIELMKAVGFAVAVVDAMQKVKEAAHYVTEKAGGHGAVREVTDLLLKAHGKM